MGREILTLLFSSLASQFRFRVLKGVCERSAQVFTCFFSFSVFAAKYFPGDWDTSGRQRFEVLLSFFFEICAGFSDKMFRFFCGPKCDREAKKSWDFS